MVIWLAIRLWTGKALQAALGAFTRWPMQCVIVVLVVLSAWLWRAERRAVDALATFKAETIAAQAESTRRALAAKQATEQHYKDIANEADIEHTKALDDARNATARYIAAHRVRIDGPHPTSGTVASAESGGAQSGDGPGTPADMVAVTSDDVMICTENTKRLQGVRDWALAVSETPIH